MKKINVVIADTSDVLLNTLKDSFEKNEAFCVLGAVNDGEQVLKLLNQERIDIVITDIILPVIDGFSLIEHVMKNQNIINKPKFIVLSGISNEKIINTAFTLGAAYFMLKPFDVELLINRVKQLANLEYTEQNILFTQNTNSLVELDIEEPVSQPSPQKDMELRITEIMHELCVPAHIKGYRYLVQSILLCVKDMEMLGAVTKIMYPEIAKMFGTTPSRVERAIRHSIELSWQMCSPSKLYKIFGYTVNTKKGKPTNSEYIALIADKVRLEYKQKEQKVM